MRLSDNIFKITEDNLKFLRYFLTHPKLFISDLCKEFNIGKNNLNNHLNLWEEQGYIIKERVPPMLGGKRYQYSLSEKAKEKLKDIKALTSELGI